MVEAAALNQDGNGMLGYPLPPMSLVLKLLFCRLAGIPKTCQMFDTNWN